MTEVDYQALVKKLFKIIKADFEKQKTLGNIKPDMLNFIAESLAYLLAEIPFQTSHFEYHRLFCQEYENVISVTENLKIMIEKSKYPENGFKLDLNKMLPSESSLRDLAQQHSKSGNYLDKYLEAKEAAKRKNRNSSNENKYSRIDSLDKEIFSILSSIFIAAAIETLVDTAKGTQKKKILGDFTSLYGKLRSLTGYEIFKTYEVRSLENIRAKIKKLMRARTVLIYPLHSSFYLRNEETGLFLPLVSSHNHYIPLGHTMALYADELTKNKSQK